MTEAEQELEPLLTLPEAAESLFGDRAKVRALRTATAQK